MKLSKKYFTLSLFTGVVVGVIGLTFITVLSHHSAGAQTTAPVLYDNKRNVLGQIVSGNGSSFYNPTINRLVTFSSGKISTNVGAVYFTSTDCSGLALLPQNSVTNPTLVLIKLATGKYYVDDPHATLQPKQLGSYLSADGSCKVVTWTGLSPVDPIFPVNLSFPDPLLTPLSIAP